MAAGIALVREAGGFVTDMDGREIALSSAGIIAANETLHPELLRKLNEAGRTDLGSPTP
jgi:myo-inositol-1(or 4)-monophosphatase